jgi:hypothetical protein
MSRFIPVNPEKWAAMVQAQSDLPRWKEMCDELDARCNELKAELASLRASSFVTAVPVEQYERVVKAGDAMASSIQFNEEMAQDYSGPTIVHQSVQRWNAAKEGKPSV